MTQFRTLPHEDEHRRSVAKIGRELGITHHTVSRYLGKAA